MPSHPAVQLCSPFPLATSAVAVAVAAGLAVVACITAACCHRGLSMFGASAQSAGRLLRDTGVGNCTAHVTTGEHCTAGY